MGQHLLVLDTASPTVSLAIGDDHGRLASRQIELRQSSEKLFFALDEVLAEMQASLADLRGMVILQGPGSFTGLRVGMAVVLGLHQALGIPATAVPTLPILARTAKPRDGERLVPAVDAMRGDWYAQSMTAEFEPAGEAGLHSPEDLARLAPCCLIGFGVERLAEVLPETIRRVEPPPLAQTALRDLLENPPEWDPQRLTRPIYFRAPAVTLPSTVKSTSP